MGVDLQTISQLRERTGAGIGDCKNALTEANGDMEKAIEVLRKKGEIKAAKKSDRATNEGLVSLAFRDDKIAGVAVACETDFVSRGEDFIMAVDGFSQKLLTSDQASFRSWAEDSIKSELVVKIGENIKLLDFGITEGGVLGSYLHANKKVAGVVSLTLGNKELASEIAMQVVAMSPRYLNPEEVPAEIVAKEKEIYEAQLKQENKPEAIWDKIIQGKLNKFFEDVCLTEQIFIKDDTKKIKDLLGGAKIKEFRKYQI
ncbi:MAG: translation elongation factor Ts [Patescibacteria group bacterium]